MTKHSDLIARIEAAEGPVLVKAEFGCGRYSDGSGPVVTVGYDTSDPKWAKHIVLDGFTLTIPVEHAEEVIEAIRCCAAALRAQEASE